MFCPFCGKELVPGQAYCPSCGANVASTTYQPQPPPSQYPYTAPTPARTVKLSTFVLIVGVLAIILLFTASALILQVNVLETQLQHPSVELWNSCGGPCTMTSNGWRAGTVPDTFDYYVSFNATVPVAVYFLTLSQYVQFTSCGRPTCVSGTFSTIQATTSVSNSIFTLAEGCASYVAVYQSTQAGVMYPNVRATYNPASSTTGACA